MDTDKVVLAEESMIVHVSLGESLKKGDPIAYESKFLFPGESIDLKKLVEYQQEAVLKNRIPGLKLVDVTEAEKILQAAKIVSSKEETPDNVVS